MLKSQHRQSSKLKKHRDMLQIKYLEKTLKILNETKISNLSDKEFKVMIIKMRTKRGKRIDKCSENFNKER